LFKDTGIWEAHSDPSIRVRPECSNTVFEECGKLGICPCSLRRNKRGWHFSATNGPVGNGKKVQSQLSIILATSELKGTRKERDENVVDC